MKKYVSIGMTIVLAAALAAGCSTPSGSGGDAAGQTSPANNAEGGANIGGKITFVTQRTDLVNTKFKEYADAFKKKYPSVKEVEFEAIKDYDATMKVRLSTGDLGDVSVMPNNIPLDKLNEYYVALDDLGLNDKVYFPEWRASGGKTYGLASGVSTNGIVYNKKAFEKAGITSAPKTWDEFLAACEKLKQAGITPLATNFKDKWPLQEWDFLANAISGDPLFRTNLSKSDTPFSPDSPHGKSLTILRTLIDKGYTEKDLMSTDWESSKKDVATGKTGMYLIGNWVINQLVEAGGAKPEDIGFFPLPYDNSGKYNVNYSPDYVYAVSKNSKNPATAKAFVKFLLEDSDYAEYSGFIPPLKSKQPSLPQLKEFLSASPKVIEPKVDSVEYTNVANKAQIDFYGGVYIQTAMLKNKDLKASLDELNKKWADARKALGVK